MSRRADEHPTVTRDTGICHMEDPTLSSSPIDHRRSSSSPGIHRSDQASETVDEEQRRLSNLSGPASIARLTMLVALGVINLATIAVASCLPSALRPGFTHPFPLWQAACLTIILFGAQLGSLSESAAYDNILALAHRPSRKDTSPAPAGIGPLQRIDQMAHRPSRKETPAAESATYNYNASAAVLITCLLLAGAGPTIIILIVAQILSTIRMTIRNGLATGWATIRQSFPNQLIEHINTVIGQSIAVTIAGILLLPYAHVPWDGSRPWPDVVYVIPPILILSLVSIALDEILKSLQLGITSPRHLVLRVWATGQRVLPWELCLGFLGLLGALVTTNGPAWSYGLFGFVFVLQKTYQTHATMVREHAAASVTLQKAVASVTVQQIVEAATPQQAVESLRPPTDTTTPVKRINPLQRQEMHLSPEHPPDLLTVSRMAAAQIDRDRELLRYKDDFMSLVSHELRSPITVLMGTMEMLYARRLHMAPGDPIIPDLNRLRTHIIHMATMIDVVLDSARHQADIFHIEPQPDTDLGCLVHDTVDRFSSPSSPQRISAAGDVSLPAYCDAARISQVLTNLISNALKYSPRGSSVVVDLRRHGDFALISVRDQGMGIPAAEQERIFSRFERASNVGAIPGLGAGLYVSKNIVERHGGRIWLQSVEHQGSTFFITIPLAAPPVIPPIALNRDDLGAA